MEISGPAGVTLENAIENAMMSTCVTSEDLATYLL